MQYIIYYVIPSASIHPIHEYELYLVSNVVHIFFFIH